MQNPSQVIAKSVLLERISGDTPDCTDSSLKTHISHLRKKLRDIGGKEYIDAGWGIDSPFGNMHGNSVQCFKCSILFRQGICSQDIIHKLSLRQQGTNLTRTEYAILKILMQNPSQVIAKSVLLERITALSFQKVL